MRASPVAHEAIDHEGVSLHKGGDLALVRAAPHQHAAAHGAPHRPKQHQLAGVRLVWGRGRGQEGAFEQEGATLATGGRQADDQARWVKTAGDMSGGQHPPRAISRHWRRCCSR